VGIIFALGESSSRGLASRRLALSLRSLEELISFFRLLGPLRSSPKVGALASLTILSYVFPTAARSSGKLFSNLHEKPL